MELLNGVTLRDELRFAVRSDWVTKAELAQCGEWAQQASFVHRLSA